MELKSTSKERGIKPGFVKGPIIVYVFPEPVIPYVKSTPVCVSAVSTVRTGHNPILRTALSLNEIIQQWYSQFFESSRLGNIIRQYMAEFITRLVDTESAATCEWH